MSGHLPTGIFMLGVYFDDLFLTDVTIDWFLTIFFVMTKKNLELLLTQEIF